MKPYEIINEAKDLINDLKYNLQYSKNKIQDAKRINTLIDLVECFEMMLLDKYKTDALDNLILTIFYDQLMHNEVYSRTEIPLYYIYNHIVESLSYNSSYRRKDVVDLLHSVEMNKMLESGDIKEYTDVNPLIDEILYKAKSVAYWKIKNENEKNEYRTD